MMVKNTEHPSHLVQVQDRDQSRVCEAEKSEFKAGKPSFTKSCEMCFKPTCERHINTGHICIHCQEEELQSRNELRILCHQAAEEAANMQLPIQTRNKDAYIQEGADRVYKIRQQELRRKRVAKKMLEQTAAECWRKGKGG